jgi:hypothetical protein
MSLMPFFKLVWIKHSYGLLSAVSLNCTCKVTDFTNPMLGGITGLPCSWRKWIQEPDPPGWGSLKNRDNKLCSWILWDSDLRKAALAMPGQNWKVQTRLLVREGAPHQQTRNCLNIIKERMGKIGRWSQMGTWHQDGLADWLSVVI